ncbi:MAG: hypothetical protein A2912_00375 [Candidatus Buchananbacteria bacterium RIFCSPLOWO2_01_FULL_40_23b]|uniref:Uncharacterized protein n=1 Tax=Candidatus Buchananbacteria bacterium RIFCSPLOWO2_01_FULL_40_23b TaxID=1797544 RepID=A0A1G1YLI9_9BACT|nr:MAG: hypothetical protein A2912_00375 [Candidatus Buchananbacteria bacterium RIFCSPLOWO2_01_FULL_40_23b]
MEKVTDGHPNTLTEKCVICKTKTSIPQTLHIEDPRRNDKLNMQIGSHYKECVGQLCDACFEKFGND